jgi:hypothetical protein
MKKFKLKEKDVTRERAALHILTRQLNHPLNTEETAIWNELWEWIRCNDSQNCLAKLPI